MGIQCWLWQACAVGAACAHACLQVGWQNCRQVGRQVLLLLRMLRVTLICMMYCCI
jgi:hypothetical protein